MNPNERNIADALAEHLPKAELLLTLKLPDHAGDILQFAVPARTEIREVDLERLLPNPRRTNGTAALATADSFLDYVQRHALASTKVWCNFDPQTYKLSFTAVIDDHQKDAAGWRGHKATFTPALGAEWKVWTGMNGKDKVQSQTDFAAFIESNANDINVGPEGKFPTSLAMLQLATQFEATGDKRIKSAIRLQSGAIELQYTDGESADTVAKMEAFDKFMIGIPVFWAGPAYRIEARLRYRTGSGKVVFWYELVRPDLAHETAANDTITFVRTALVPMGVPFLFGSCQ